jgi:sugar phosphate isomerase/epimerase
MKLAASNIGWEHTVLPTMLPELQRRGVEGLVIAPTMVWAGAPDTVKPGQAAEFRSRVEASGLHIVGMQSLTYGMEEATNLSQYVVVERLKRQAELAGRLGATSLILGSPNLRKERPDRFAHPERGYGTEDIVSALGDVARVAADNGTKLCIEPLSGYGVKYVKNTAEGVDLTRYVHDRGRKERQGFGLHLDAASLAGEPDFHPSSQIPTAQRSVGITSFDASAPDLMPPSQDTTVPHHEIATTLRRVGFDGFVSLEMRRPQDPNNPNFDPVAAYLAEVDFVSQQYGFQQQQ